MDRPARGDVTLIGRSVGLMTATSSMTASRVARGKERAPQHHRTGLRLHYEDAIEGDRGEAFPVPPASRRWQGRHVGRPESLLQAAAGVVRNGAEHRPDGATPEQQRAVAIGPYWTMALVLRPDIST